LCPAAIKGRTVNCKPVPESSGITSLVVERVKYSVNAELELKGLIMSSSNPDILIAQHLGKKDKVQVTDWGYGYGPYRGYWGGYWDLLVGFLHITTKKEQLF
jgi:hypothetical protein